MDISMNAIDKITFDCFTNKSQFNDLIEKQNLFQSNQFVKEKRFYRKRILNITRELFANEINNIELKNTFNNYVKSIINYLKFIDKKDILQEEYLDLSSNDVEKKVTFEKTESEKKEHYDEANKLIINNDYNKIDNTLDNYVIKTIVNNEDENIKNLPQKKIINLKDPVLKKKGIKKKKKDNLNS
jgi:hypothetical protein